MCGIKKPMSDVIQPGVLETPKRRRPKLKITDIIIFSIILIVIVVLSVTIISKLQLKHEVSQAKAVSDKVIAAMSKQDTAAIRSLGDKKFQAKNSAASLNSALTFRPADSEPITFSNLYGDSKPSVADQIVANNSTGKHVAIIYRYDKLKVPFFVRVETAESKGATNWTLQSLSASSNESSLMQ